MWIAAYVICAWLVASVLVIALFAMLFAGAKRGERRPDQSLPAQSINAFATDADESTMLHQQSVPTGWPDRSPSPTHLAA